MKKQMSFSLQKEEVEKFKDKIAKSIQGKTLSNFILNEYTLPTDLSVLEKGEGDYVVEPFRLLTEVDEVLTRYVAQGKEAGFSVNKSSIMRDVFKKLNATIGDDRPPVSKREIKYSNFYCERSAKELLEKWIDYRYRNFVIEEFILNEFSLPEGNDRLFKEKPDDVVLMRLGMDPSAYKKLDDMLDGLEDKKGVTRSTLLRVAVKQLLEKVTGNPHNELLLQKKLDDVIEQYKQVAGQVKVSESISKYLKDEE